MPLDDGKVGSWREERDARKGRDPLASAVPDVGSRTAADGPDNAASERSAAERAGCNGILAMLFAPPLLLVSLFFPWYSFDGGVGDSVRISAWEAFQWIDLWMAGVALAALSLVVYAVIAAVQAARSTPDNAEPDPIAERRLEERVTRISNLGRLLALVTLTTVIWKIVAPDTAEGGFLFGGHALINATPAWGAFVGAFATASLLYAFMSFEWLIEVSAGDRISA